MKTCDKHCDENWRKIVKESSPLLGKKFINNGRTYTFVGIVYSNDGYYYLMSYMWGYMRLSCVSSIEDHGFVLDDGGEI